MRSFSPKANGIMGAMKKDIFWNSLGTAAWSFLSLFLLIIVTRINGIVDSGLFSFGLAFALIMFTIACYGGRAYQVSDHKDAFKADTYISLRLFMFVPVLLITVAFVLLNHYEWQKLALIVLLVGQRMFDAIADVFYGIMQKKRHLYISGKSLFFKSLLSLIIFLVIDLLTKNLLLSALSLPIISLLFVLFYDIPQSRKLEHFSIKPSSSEIKRILKSTFLPFVITVMSLIFVNLARYFIDIYHPELQGYFGIIIMPLSLIILLFSFISTPAVLHLSEKYNNQEFNNLNRSIGKIVGIILAVTVVFVVLTYLLAIPLLRLLFNIDFTAYLFDVVLVIVIGLAISINSLFTNVAIIARKLRTVAIISLSSIVILIVLCALLVNQYQIRGAIIAYIIASITQVIMLSVYHRHITRS
jgi:O-antigen/teichoic acid export membrane protein